MTRKNKPFVYLDHSATTPVDPRVADAVHQAMIKGWGNPSSKYSKGSDAKLLLDKARQEVAGLINADPQEIFFTSGGTEADNLAVIGVMEQARKDGRGTHLITTSFEHSAILKAADHLEENGFTVTRLALNADGFITPDVLKAAITSDTVLVSIMHVNNEIGTIQPIRELAAICHESGILFHTDAVQSYGKVPIDVKMMNLDMVSMSSHKIYGPKGVGALYVKSGVPFASRQFGGGQESGVRTGTENMPGIVGFGAASAICAEEISSENQKMSILRNKLLTLIREGVDGEVLVNGSLENRLGANLNLRFPDVEGESLMLALDLDGIACSTGSACSSGSTKPSHVLSSIGLSGPDAHSSLRFTLGRTNDEKQIRYAAERIIHHVNKLRAMLF